MAFRKRSQKNIHFGKKENQNRMIKRKLNKQGFLRISNYQLEILIEAIFFKTHST